MQGGEYVDEHIDRRSSDNAHLSIAFKNIKAGTNVTSYPPEASPEPH